MSPPSVRRVLLGALAVLAAGAPLFVVAIVRAVQHQPIYLDGDSALDELYLRRALHFQQLLGNESWTGWNHPGPAQFYILASVYGPLGARSWAYPVAVMVFQGLTGACIVAFAWRRSSVIGAAIVSIIVLVYLAELNGTFANTYQMFMLPWPPWFLPLPAALFFLLVAAAAAGSPASLGGALFVGTFLAQTDVGTVPTVGVLLAVASVGFGIARVARLRSLTGWAGSPERTGRRGWVVGAIWGVAGLAMWIPVAVQQLTSHPGNLTLLWRFFTTPRPGRASTEALSYYARQLLVFPFNQPLSNYEDYADWSRLTPARDGLIGLVAVAALLLLVAGLVQRRRVVTTLGLVTLLAQPMVVISASRIVGSMNGYILLWVAAIPLVVIIGWVIVLVGSARVQSVLRRLPSDLGAAGAVAAVTICAILLSVLFLRQPPQIVTDNPVDPASRPSWHDTRAALSGRTPSTIEIFMGTQDVTQVGSGVADQLEMAGWTVTVNSDWAWMFGTQMRPTGHEHYELYMVDAPQAAALQQSTRGLRPIGTSHGTHLLLRVRSG